MRKNTTQHAAILFILLAALAACDNNAPNPDQLEFNPEKDTKQNEHRDIEHKPVTENQATQSEGVAKFALIESSTVEIEAKSGSSVSGTVIFSPGPDKESMQVKVKLSGLEPGIHGFHIHESDDCSADDASSAGGHFNPFNAEHGAPSSERQHLGDMGNVEANAQGNVNTTLMFADMSFSGPNSILQRAVVVHAQQDDFTSVPSGDAGKRIGCGEIVQDRGTLRDNFLD